MSEVTDGRRHRRGPQDWLTLPDVAERLDVPVTKVRQMLRERRLLAVRTEGVLRCRPSSSSTGPCSRGCPGC